MHRHSRDGLLYRTVWIPGRSGGPQPLRDGLLVVPICGGPTNSKEGGVQSAHLLLEGPFDALDYETTRRIR